MTARLPAMVLAVIALLSPLSTAAQQAATAPGEWNLGRFQMPGSPVDGKPFALIQRRENFIMLGCGRAGDPLSVVFGLRRTLAPQSLVKATSAAVEIALSPNGGAPISGAFAVNRRESIDGAQFLNFSASIRDVEIADQLRGAQALTITWPGTDGSLAFDAANSAAAIDHLTRYCAATG